MSRTTRILTPLLLLAFTVALFLGARQGWNRLPIPTTQPLADGSPQSWRDRFERTYTLDPGEIARFIPAPFIPERTQYLAADRSYQGAWVQDFQLGFRFDDQRRAQNWSMSTARGTLSSAVSICSDLSRARLEIAPGLGSIPLHGDWIVRDPPTTPIEQRMHALQHILRSATGRPIVIEKVTRPRDVWVLTGTYTFKPLPDAKDQRAIHLYCEKLDEPSGSGGGSGKFDRLLERLEDLTKGQIINNSATPKNTSISWRNHPDASKASNDPKAAQRLIDNLPQQTGLTFTPQAREVEIWLVHERP